MKARTKLIHHARPSQGEGYRVNPPIERGSTLLFSSTQSLYDNSERPTYGRLGLEPHRSLEAALGALEGGQYVQLTPSGLSACTLAMAALARAGGHILITDSVYGPTRRFGQHYLKRMGVEAEFYNPRIGADIAGLIRPNTCCIFMESPGSLTFEVQDIPAITDMAHTHNIPSIVDNTWGAGVFLNPLELGADISVQALTKYVCGHSDTFCGAVISKHKDMGAKVLDCAKDMGLSVSPENAYEAMKGLRTLHSRLEAHQANGLALAKWLQERPEVLQILHPGLEAHPDHAIWKRDFTGACGLFSCILHPVSNTALEVFFSALKCFGMGFSWGGFESLAIPCDPQLKRRSEDWSTTRKGSLIRFHAGLEDITDLTADLDQAFSVMNCSE